MNIKTVTTLTTTLAMALLINCLNMQGTRAQSGNDSQDAPGNFHLPVANIASEQVDGDPSKLVKESIFINSPPDNVLWVIEEHRKGDELNQHRECASCHSATAEIKEDKYKTFVLGDLHNVWEERKVSPWRINFKLISSDKLKQGYGFWLITPLPNSQTCLELDSYVCSYKQIKWSEFFTQRETRKDNQTRLRWIKRDAEADNKK